ncbi:hypothetical protein I5Q49_06300 [Pseudomonas carnis]|uniref:hypothetical protein n=1 Tax=Pseudomonas carnis TaxID=2487355 RepID=UPI0018D8E39D|nr:hypothetical protein [Pseudomonas carnis]MBH3464456.1 hypothetical protein [Pseudomonas carnis]
MFIVYLVSLAIRVFELDSSDVASWVQAFGAIISIWAAWWIASQQSKRAEAENKTKDLAKFYAVIGILEHILSTIKLEPRTGPGTISGEDVRAEVGKVLSMLDRVDVLTLPNPVLVESVFQTRRALEGLDLKARDYLRNYRTSIMLLHYDISMSLPCITSIEEQIKLCKEFAGSYL